ncbi:hypothetical protein M8C21_031589 [Ambrosia artemisiifolia]|uniref:Ubiquitinyl hydrolase 1 n=1 Tax=Ambrosia artemisiifolia TaxID=4212 RepID=A0AAD5GDQ3_AMBAR|nr:hypothetical protein M8C21_031589 [Ambrosia artemisiifolia]
MTEVLMAPVRSPEEERLVMRDIAMAAGEAQAKEGDTFCLINQRETNDSMQNLSLEIRDADEKLSKTEMHFNSLIGKHFLTRRKRREISTKNGSVTGVSPDQEREVIMGITEDDEPQAKEGDTYYLISYRWWQSWSAFVNQNPTTSSSSSILQRPPSIDNSDLICESSPDNSTIDIHDTLVEGTDYILVTERIWNQFYAWYGGGPTLARKILVEVIDNSGNYTTAVQGELAMAFGELLRRLWAPGRTAFAPRSFKAKLARFAPQFGGHNQHDSQELLAFLLDGLHEDLNRVKKRPYIKSRDADDRPDEQLADEYWANHISRNDSIIVDVCQFPALFHLTGPVQIDFNLSSMKGVWKPYGTPLVFPISNDATITRGDIQLIAHTMLSPMLKPKNVAPITSSGPPSATNGIKKEYSPCKENGDSLVKLPLKLVNGNNDLIDISIGEEKTINLSSSSMLVVLYIDWSPELVKKYETHYLENLPEVSRNGHMAKKARIEPLSLYTCIEAFLREEPLVPEDMCFVFCPQCKEQRQASKKLDLWRLPELINENKWYNFDDNHVSAISEDDVKSNAAYEGEN